MELRKKKRVGKRQTQAQVWRGSSSLASCMSVFLGTSRIMCLYACTIVILFAQQAQQDSNHRWTYRKVNNSKNRKRQLYSVRAVTHQNTIPFIHTNSHQYQTYVISLVCGPKQGSQRAGFPDVSYYPAALTRPSWSPYSLSLTSQNQKGRSKAD